MVERSRAFLAGAVSLFILSNALRHLGDPLINDEASVALWLNSQSFWGVINPFSESRPGSPHTIATLLSWITTRLLGMSEVNLRLPSILFTGIFLWLLYGLSLRMKSFFTVALIYLHLTVNEVFQWYTYYFRGHLSIMTAGLWLYLLTGEYSENYRKNSWPLMLAFVLCGVTGALGGAFALLVLTAFLAGTKKYTFSFPKSSVAWALLGIGVLVLVAVGVVTYPPFVARFFQNPKPIRFEELGMLFGYSYTHFCYFLSLLPVMLFLFAKTIAAKKTDFTTILFGLSLAVLTLAVVLAQDDVRGRYLLPFLVPFLHFMGNSTELFARRSRIAIQAALLWLLVGVPLMSDANRPSPQTEDQRVSWESISPRKR